MIRKVEVKDLKEIVNLHIESFKGHFLAKLGNKLLQDYYREFIDADNVFLVNVDNNKINGLVLGTPSSATGRNRFIKNNIIKLAFRMFCLCIKGDRDTWERVIGGLKLVISKCRKKTTVVEQKNDKKIISLLSICVGENVQGKNIANILVNGFEKEIEEREYSEYILTVYKSNIRAIKFYEKIGMKVYKESKSEYGYVKILGGSND